MHNKRLLNLFFLCALSLFSRQLQALEREDAIKAGLIYNFAYYSQQQTKSASKINYYSICSTSEPFIKAARKTLTSKTLASKPIKVSLIPPDNTISECHIVFFNNQTLFQQYNDNEHPSKPLLIGQFSNFIEMGGHINFIIVGGKLRFEINPKQLNRSGIKISSKVMRLGIVKQENFK